jgi:hypothetical protein
MKKVHFRTVFVPIPILLKAIGLCVIILAATDGPLAAQTVKVPLTLAHWDTVGMKVFKTETFKGKECLLLSPGYISAKGVDLREGTIEADISFTSQRGFPGIGFHIQDRRNLELFYVRPHQSGNPDATQYTPVFNGQAGWQLYHGEGYSKAVPYRFDDWHHIRIDIHGLQAEIYIDDMMTPVIKVAELLRGWQGGTFGITSEGVPLRVANVQYTIRQSMSTPKPAPVPANGTDGVVTQWNVSDVVSRNVFGKKFELTKDIKDKLMWTSKPTEPSGTLNLARFGAISEASNTAVARIVIESQSDQVKVLNFGFSDFVTVYLNDKAIFSGADNFLSRDYRFLGTIGYFDTVFLPLKKGTNELWFVVSENFGGWGVRAKFESMEGIALK